MIPRLNAVAAAYAAIPPNVRGMALVLAAAFSVNAMNVVLRGVADDVHVFVIAFFRHVFGFLLFAPLFLRSGSGMFVTRRLGLLTLRAVLNVTAMLLYFFAVMLIPLAEVTALSFTTPLFVIVLAVLLLGERMNRWRWIGLGLGLAGALVILRPGLQSIETGSLLVVLSSSFWACALIAVKVLTRTESPVTITMYASLLQIPFSLALALFRWSWPSPSQFAMILVIAVFGTAAHFCVAQAFREADASVVMPADFTKLVFAGVMGYVFFAEVPDVLTLVGGAIVFSGVIFIALRERGRSRLSSENRL